MEGRWILPSPKAQAVAFHCSCSFNIHVNKGPFDVRMSFGHFFLTVRNTGCFELMSALCQQHTGADIRISDSFFFFVVKKRNRRSKTAGYICLWCFSVSFSGDWNISLILTKYWEHQFLVFFFQSWFSFFRLLYFYFSLILPHLRNKEAINAVNLWASQCWLCHSII